MSYCQVEVKVCNRIPMDISSASSFYCLRQLQRSRRSLNTESTATLLHSFIASRIDYCNAVLAGAPKATTNKLQLVLNAAARVVSGTHKFDWGLSRLLHTELQWLDVPERVVYKLGVMVFNCLHGQAPQYLVELCQPVAGVASWQHLWSTTQQLLVVPRHQLSSYGRLAFCVAGPSVWNFLLDSLRNPIIGGNSFRQSLKTFPFAMYWFIQHIRGFATMRYINRLFTYLLQVYRP